MKGKIKMSNELTTGNMSIAKTIESAGMYISFIPETPEAQAALFEALTTPTHESDEMINQVINLKNIVAVPAEKTDKDGKTDDFTRIILIDDKGESTSFGSKGMLTAVQNLCMVFGAPGTWKNPIPVKLKQVKVERGTMFTLELVTNKK